MLFLQNLALEKRMVIYYHSNGAKQLAGREFIVSNGAIVGGYSVVVPRVA